MQQHHHTPGDFLLSISGTLMAIGFSEVNQLLAFIAAALTIVLTGFRIKQARQEIKDAKRKREADKHFRK